MEPRDNSPFARALAQVADFSEKEVAVLPENPGREMLHYAASVTGEDADKLARLYQVFISLARLDKFNQDLPSAASGFAEE